MKIYIVQKGDTLHEIAQKNGQSLATLREMNPDITNSNNIKPGMKIKVPTEAKPVRKEGIAKQIPLKKFQSKSMPVSEFLSNKEKKVSNKPSSKKENKANIKSEANKQKSTKSHHEANVNANEPKQPVEQKKTNEKKQPNKQKKAHEKKLFAKQKEKASNEKQQPNKPKENPEANQKVKEPIEKSNMNKEPIANEPEHKMLNNNILAPLQPLDDNEWAINTNNKAENVKPNIDIPLLNEEYPNLMGPAKEANKKPKHEENYEFKPNSIPYKPQNMPIHHSYTPNNQKKKTTANKDQGKYGLSEGQTWHQPIPTYPHMPQSYGMPSPYGGQSYEGESSSPFFQGGTPETYNTQGLPYQQGVAQPYPYQAHMPSHQGMPGPYGGPGFPYEYTPPTHVVPPRDYQQTNDNNEEKQGGNSRDKTNLYGGAHQAQSYGYMPSPYNSMHGSSHIPFVESSPHGDSSYLPHGDIPMDTQMAQHYPGIMQEDPSAQLSQGWTTGTYVGGASLPQQGGHMPSYQGMPGPYGGAQFPQGLTPPPIDYGYMPQMTPGVPSDLSAGDLSQGGTYHRGAHQQAGQATSYQGAYRPYGNAYPQGLMPPPYIGFSNNQDGNQRNLSASNKGYNKNGNNNKQKKND